MLLLKLIKGTLWQVFSSVAIRVHAICAKAICVNLCSYLCESVCFPLCESVFSSV